MGERESRRRCVMVVVDKVDRANSIRIIVDKLLIPWWTRCLESSMMLAKTSCQPVERVEKGRTMERITIRTRNKQNYDQCISLRKNVPHALSAN